MQLDGPAAGTPTGSPGRGTGAPGTIPTTSLPTHITGLLRDTESLARVAQRRVEHGGRQDGEEGARRERDQEAVRELGRVDPIVRRDEAGADQRTMRACVVEIGKPARVANRTVRPAESATAAGKAGLLTTSGGTRPLPEKAARSPCARISAVTDPTTVVIVAHDKARRYEDVPLPKSVATPLKLSFAQFAKARSSPISAMRADSEVLLVPWPEIGPGGHNAPHGPWVDSRSAGDLCPDSRETGGSYRDPDSARSRRFTAP